VKRKYGAGEVAFVIEQPLKTIPLNEVRQSGNVPSDYTKKTELIDGLMVGLEDYKAVFIPYRSLPTTEPVT
jgi:hypothetical protein